METRVQNMLRRKYKVKGLTKVGARESLFSLEKDGEKKVVSVFDFYREEHDVTCARARMPPDL